MEFRKNPCLLLYARSLDHGRYFCVETNTFNAPIVIKNSALIKLLCHLPEIFTAEVFARSLAEMGVENTNSNELLQHLQNNRLVIANTEVKNLFPTLVTWEKYNWNEAFIYQAATKDYPFIKMDESDAFERDMIRMKEFKREDPVPAIYQEFNAQKRVYLKHFNFKQSLEKVAQNLKAKKDKFGMLSLFLNLCFGERKKQRFNIQGNFLRKVIPSGGSRHPTEVFYISFSNEVDRGIYHYNVKHNCLDLIKSGNYYKECKNATYDLFDKYKKKPRGMIIFTVVHNRSMWRYRDSRSWRAILIDLGHALMVYRQLAIKLGWKYYTYQKFKDRDIAKLLEVNPVRQTPLYVGTII